jgi:hypothetical protein
MSAKRFAVSAESPIAGMSSTIAAVIDDVSPYHPALVTFRMVNLMEVGADTTDLAEHVIRRMPRRKLAGPPHQL